MKEFLGISFEHVKVWTLTVVFRQFLKGNPMTVVRKLLLAALLFTAASASAVALDASEVYIMLANGVTEDVIINVVSAQGLSQQLTPQDVYSLRSVGATDNFLNTLTSLAVAPAPVMVAPAPVVVAPQPVYVAPAPHVYYAPPRRSGPSFDFYFGGGRGPNYYRGGRHGGYRR